MNFPKQHALRNTATNVCITTGSSIICLEIIYYFVGCVCNAWFSMSVCFSCDDVLVIILFKTRPSASADNSYLDLDYSGYQNNPI